MKRFVSIVLTIMMIVSMFTTVSADIGSSTSGVANPLQLLLGVETLARKSGTSDEYSSTLDLKSEAMLSGIGVDYKSTLNMAPVRALFDRNFIKTVIPGNSDLNTEFNSGKVNTTVVVEITYPAAATISGNLLTAGVLDAGSIFTETAARVVDGNSIKITYGNTTDILVSELSANKDTYLKDISFILDNVVSYSTFKNHSVKVKLTGSTTIQFTSKTQTVNYTGEASNIVSAEANHVLKVVPVVPATCDEKGWTEGVKCQTHNSYACGANGLVEPQQTIEKLTHALTFIERVNPSCIATGVKEHYMCILCKKDFANESATTPLTKAELTLAKVPHTDVPIAAVPATCTENGLTAGAVCSVCGHTQTREIIHATGHSESVLPGTAATCETAGLTEGKECSVCHTVLVAQKPVAAKGHKWGEWNITLAPTEDSVGSKTRTCLNDSNHTETVEIPKLAHTCVIKTEAAVITKAPTCTEKGLKQNYCACGKEVGDPEEISAIGHNATQISNLIPATCTTEGVLAHWACANCGGLFTEAACVNKITSPRIQIDTTNHGSKVKVPAIAPTCESDGLTEGEKCVACKKITIPQVEVSKTGHSFEVVAGEAATCTETGIHEHKHCTVCDKDYALDGVTEVTSVDYILSALGHSFNFINMTVITAPTEEEEGKGRIDCERCDHYKEVPIAKLQHVHNEECEKIITPATCTTPGLKRIVYTCCNEIKQDNIPIPAAHSPRKINAVPADCFTPSISEHWYCSVCDKLFKDAACSQPTTIAQLTGTVAPHNYVEHHRNANHIFYKCSVCNSMQKVDNIDGKAKVKENGNDKDKKDKVKEDRINETQEETGRKAYVYPETNLEEKEISSVLEKEIHKNDTETKKASEEKVVIDITVEKVTLYVDKSNNKEVHELIETEILDEEREVVTETNDLKEIEIIVPVSMRGFVDFIVHRLHNGVVEEIKTTPNADGEYIVIASNKSTVTLFVKKFSEYALVGYDTVVNPSPIVNTGGGGGSSGSVTVKFVANGGKAVDNIKVKSGSIITAPVTTRDGYILEGWYIDYSLTKPFDFSTAITSNMTLYAKWVEGTSAGDCPGTPESDCPCYDFNDLNGKEWYHEGVDYVLNNKMMIGLEEGVFGPDESLTRAMLVTVLYRKEGEPATNRSIPFADIDMSEYYANAVSWAQQNGIVKGVSETHFAPNDNITREQIAAIIFRYAQFKGMNAVTLEENLHFADSNEISEYAVSAMNWAVGSGLIKGRTETTLNPTANTTRAEIAVILYRFFETIAK